MQTKVFSEENFFNIDFANCSSVIINEFIRAIKANTLGYKILKAIELRSKGHFNDAMLAMSEINRDHIQAIRNVQRIIDKDKEQDYIDVIFDKYRQTFPFQVGLINGEDVILLLSLIKFKNSDIINKKECEIESLSEELHFYETRMKDRVSEIEINDIYNKIEIVEKSLFESKKRLIEEINLVVSEKFNNVENELKVLAMKNLFILKTSSIETLSSENVDVVVRI